VADEIIGGYRLANLMMTGQSSQVWEVVDTSSHRHFAMKLLLPEKLKDEDQRRFLIHEAEVGQKLAHPNIIKIMNVIKDKKNPYFVMEFFPAGSLKLRMIRKQFEFIREQTPSILKQTATALAYMNASGWVHRDVKPDNILVNSAGEVRIIDFALAVRIQKKPGFFGRMFGKKKKGKVQGTRSYMSPEQIRGQYLDGRADMYSFACSAYEITTGRPPFRAASAQELLAKHVFEKPSSPQVYNNEITDEFADLVNRMLSKRREDRPRDFHELLMQLRTMKVFKNQAPPKDPTQ
jgi:serine/threonine protein kinase